MGTEMTGGLAYFAQPSACNWLRQLGAADGIPSRNPEED
jgi:hypothetical protein